MKKLLLASVSALALFTLAACGEGDGTAPPPQGDAGMGGTAPMDGGAGMDQTAPTPDQPAQ